MANEVIYQRNDYAETWVSDSKWRESHALFVFELACKKAVFVLKWHFQWGSTTSTHEPIFCDNLKLDLFSTPLWTSAVHMLNWRACVTLLALSRALRGSNVLPSPRIKLYFKHRIVCRGLKNGEGPCPLSWKFSSDVTRQSQNLRGGRKMNHRNRSRPYRHHFQS